MPFGCLVVKILLLKSGQYKKSCKRQYL